VHAVVNNPLGIEGASSYKLAAPGREIGMLTADGSSAVAGRTGPLAPRIPLRIIARDLDTGRRNVLDVQLADETDLAFPAGYSALGTVAPLAVGQAVYTLLDGAPARQSGRMCARFEVRGARRPLRFCNRYVGGGGGDQSGAALVADVLAATEAIDAYDVAPLHLTKVEVNLRLRRGLQQARLLGADVANAAVRRGSGLRLRLRLRRIRGAAFTKTITVRVPRGTPAGPRDLVLEGTPADDLVSAGGEIDLGALFDLAAAETDQEPATVAELRRSIARIERYDGVRARFAPFGSGDAPPDPTEEEPPLGARAYEDPDVRISGRTVIPVFVLPERRG
jgi:hypothetical protein